MPSIRQNTYSDLLPDFRNLGVIARVLVAVNAAALIAAIYAAPSVRAALERFIEDAAFIEPLLFVEVAVLFALSRQLGRLSYLGGCVAVALLSAALAAGYLAALQQTTMTIARGAFFAALLSSVLLSYFRLYVKAFSPALAEARLQALQSRIRPHFLFNSINAVLALIRRDPKRAERTLEDLADLFRSLVSDARRFVRLSDEISLLERYAEIEQLRLGERLRITWELDAAPSDALLPPLVLQPLLENAVYHGVEPATEPGEVLVRIERRGDRVLARIENPVVEASAERVGNRMAMDNIRERLALFFDAEARMDVRIQGGRYCVEIEMPYLTSARAAA
ncbi:MAG: two-component system, LytTR family, sensor histidine kinase AlgZ [Betaproteobacteria bacterium]|jgi:two-component system sensor histidine kinase AlgZ|nr:two-component system, LytTR family, sensor histidine kinase AlgZ [Betaproteobacteria bacterium]